jgi:glycosyltransferase involved in cell wall biosynthesis
VRRTLDILVLTPTFLPAIGGAEIGVHEIYSRLGARNRVVILTKQPKREMQHLAVPPGFDQTHYCVRYYQDFLNGGQVPGKMLLRGSIPPFSIGALWGADRQVRHARPDVVNVHYAAYAGLAAVWLQKVHRIPTVLSLIGRDSVPGPLVPRLWPWYAHLVASRVAHTVFISDFCRRCGQRYHKKDTFRSSVVPYGADTRRICPRPADPALLRDLRIPPGASVLFCLQRLTLLKHVELCIQSVRQLVDQGNTNLTLLVGGSGPEEQRLKKLAESLGLQEYVRFLGFVPEPEVGRYFSLADVFVFPSILETFGVVLAQAMAAGVPVVAANSSAVPEVVQHGVTGLLAAPLDVEAMTRNIALLLRDAELRTRLGKQARQVAERCYDWDKIAIQYEENLLNVVSKGKIVY